MHLLSDEDRAAASRILSWSLDRFSQGRCTPRASAPESLPSIEPHGVGVAHAWSVLQDKVLPTAIPTDDPGYLAFVPGAPSVAAVLADMAISAAGVYAGSALEAGSVVVAESAALRWLADLAGLPAGTQGAFVSGGTVANLSALAAARHAARKRRDNNVRVVVASKSAHSSIRAACAVMDAELLSIGAPDGVLTGELVRSALGSVDPASVFAVVATAGTTNSGVIDDLTDIAEVCEAHDLWLHVDAAYGGGGLLSPRTRQLFDGIGHASSITIDPHKWLFTPFDCAAVLYRDPETAREALMQRAPYLDVVDDGDNPSDYAFQLTRRARGIPLWFSLLAHGTAAYVEAIEECLDLAAYAAAAITASGSLELACEPSLSIVVFRRTGWVAADYQAWSDSVIRSGLGLITPTLYEGAPALRMCFVNPLTRKDHVDRIVGSLESGT